MLPKSIMVNCRHAHELISARMDDAPMERAERLRLWLHLKMCGLCSRVDRQMHFMRDAIRRMDQ